MIYEIVILAAIATFLGLRLYSVLGRRSEHEEEVIPHRLDRKDQVAPGKETSAETRTIRQPPRNPAAQATGASANETAIRAIAAADPQFDLMQFLEGAKAAYGMILEAFWKGDRETLRELTDDDVYEGFASAIDQREAAGETMDNRLIRIEDATVHSADLDGRQARIAVRFLADIAAVTRDREGELVAGSLDDAIESRDVWTFYRNVDSRDPNWVLDETDQG